MNQFLDPETDILGERYFVGWLVTEDYLKILIVEYFRKNWSDLTHITKPQSQQSKGELA